MCTKLFGFGIIMRRAESKFHESERGKRGERREWVRRISRASLSASRDRGERRGADEDAESLRFYPSNVYPSLYLARAGVKTNRGLTLLIFSIFLKFFFIGN